MRDNHIHEECGVLGIYSPTTYDIAADVYYGLFALQHRGQESCGITVNDDGVFTTHKDVGLVNAVFTEQEMKKLGEGSVAVGHTRYGTTGTNPYLNSQPIVTSHIKGSMAIAHNGNLTNASDLRGELELGGAIFHTTSDTEVISYLITKERLTSDSIEEATIKAIRRLEGAYSLVIMSPTKLLAARDPNGFRPLCIGKTKDDKIIFASESCALDALGAKFLRDVVPGEVVLVRDGEIISYKDNIRDVPTTFCVFEFIYFARPDSVLDNQSVHKARVRAGEILADEHPVEADVVVGVPDSGLDCAIGYAKASGLPYTIGFIKNKYIARTFIAPGQSHRENRVRIKLNPIAANIKGKRVVLIDDSIVRGTTCARIVRLLREAGAKEVHMRVSAPPFINACYYGTDIDSPESLIAANMSHREIERAINVDSLGYLSIEGAKKMAEDCNLGVCTACFDGHYPTPVPLHPQKNKFEQKINKGKN